MKNIIAFYVAEVRSFFRTEQENKYAKRWYFICPTSTVTGVIGLRSWNHKYLILMIVSKKFLFESRFIFLILNDFILYRFIYRFFIVKWQSTPMTFIFTLKFSSMKKFGGGRGVGRRNAPAQLRKSLFHDILHLFPQFPGPFSPVCCSRFPWCPDCCFPPSSSYPVD